jgi:hypothetical protein
MKKIKPQARELQGFAAFTLLHKVVVKTYCFLASPKNFLISDRVSRFFVKSKPIASPIASLTSVL